MGMTDDKEKAIARVFRDVSDGIMVVDNHGKVLYANQSSLNILGMDETVIGSKYATAVFAKDEGGLNDQFHQFVIDAIVDKEKIHKGEIDYVTSSGQKLKLEIATSFFWDDSHTRKIGLIIQFADITEVVTLRKKRIDSTVCFVMMMSIICIWNYIYTVWNVSGRGLVPSQLTFMILVMGMGAFAIIRSVTSITPAEMGLCTKNLKKSLIIDSVITVVGIVLMVILKAIMLKVAPRYFPEDAPFFNIHAQTIGQILYYIVCVIMQEFLSRGVMHENLRRILVGKHKELWALVVSSLMFGALHLHYGLAFMIATPILLCGLGILYLKQQNIWGLCIPHYFLGLALVMFGFNAM